jgi:hypothetical protein
MRVLHRTTGLTSIRFGIRLCLVKTLKELQKLQRLNMGAADVKLYRFNESLGLLDD